MNIQFEIDVKNPVIKSQEEDVPRSERLERGLEGFRDDPEGKGSEERPEGNETPKPRHNGHA